MIVEDSITEDLKRIERELKRLGKMKITVGIQGVAGKNKKGETVKASADIMTIASVHEFGATIKAKNVKNLAIPIAKKAIGKSPMDFDNLFFIRSEAGFVFGCINKKNKQTNPRVPGRPSDKKPQTRKPRNNSQIPEKDDDIEYLFILFPSVDIPERSFIRAGYDSNKDRIAEAAQRAVDNVVSGEWDADTTANNVGMTARDCIVKYMLEASNFKPKGSIVRSTSNWPDNPLAETKRLRNSVTYVISEEGQ